ncbi:MAG TPA: hypothetical protein VFZ61_16765, partial [Polyangiales bacterium]
MNERSVSLVCLLGRVHRSRGPLGHDPAQFRIGLLRPSYPDSGELRRNPAEHRSSGGNCACATIAALVANLFRLFLYGDLIFGPQSRATTMTNSFLGRASGFLAGVAALGLAACGGDEEPYSPVQQPGLAGDGAVAPVPDTGTGQPPPVADSG